MKTFRPAGRLEYADLTGPHAGAESCAAIDREIAQRERRKPGSTAGIDHWRTRRMANGELIAEPRSTIAALLLKMREQANGF